MLKSLILTIFLLSSVPSFSQEVDPALVIASVEVHQITDEKTVIELPKIPTNPVDEVAMYVDGLIAIGKKIWPIIDAGRPVITTTGPCPSCVQRPRRSG